MTDILLPPYLYPDSESVEVVDNNTTAFRPQFALGPVQRQEFGAPILKVTQKYSGTSAGDRAALLSFLRQCRGRVNSIWLTPLRYTQRGSFPAAELLNNNTFKNGTTGWTSGSSYTLSSSDRLLRSTRISVAGIDNVLISSTLTIAQYAPYVLRAMVLQGRGGYQSGFTLNDSPFFGDTVVGFGLKTQSFVPSAITDLFVLCDADGYGLMAGDFVSVPFVSYSRCALVDNSQNILQQSNAFGTSPWALGNAITGNNGTVAPDGVSNAQYLMETTSNSDHYVAQGVTVSAAAGDYALSVYVAASSRSWLWIAMNESTGNTLAKVYFNATTAAFGTIITGSGWTNIRTFAQGMGGGWWRITIVARKTSASTNLTAYVGSATADGNSSYIGTSSLVSNLMWHASLAKSSVPADDFLTTTAASAGVGQTGSALKVKGLPPSTSGLLLSGDLFQVGNELKQVTAQLNSDAAGLGYLQFEPPLFRSPADNDPVIICNPMGKFILADNGKITNQLGRYADVDLVFEEITE